MSLGNPSLSNSLQQQLNARDTAFSGARGIFSPQSTNDQFASVLAEANDNLALGFDLFGSSNAGFGTDSGDLAGLSSNIGGGDLNANADFSEDGDSGILNGGTSRFFGSISQEIKTTIQTLLAEEQQSVLLPIELQDDFTEVTSRFPLDDAQVTSKSAAFFHYGASLLQTFKHSENPEERHIAKQKVTMIFFGMTTLSVAYKNPESMAQLGELWEDISQSPSAKDHDDIVEMLNSIFTSVLKDDDMEFIPNDPKGTIPFSKLDASYALTLKDTVLQILSTSDSPASEAIAIDSGLVAEANEPSDSQTTQDEKEQDTEA